MQAPDAEAPDGSEMGVRPIPAGLGILHADDPLLEVAQREVHVFRRFVERVKHVWRWHATIILQGYWQDTGHDRHMWIQQIEYLSDSRAIALQGEWAKDGGDQLTLNFKCGDSYDGSHHPRVLRRQKLHPRAIRAGQPEKFLGEDDKGCMVELRHMSSHGLFRSGWMPIRCF